MSSNLEFWNWIKTGDRGQLTVWLDLHPEDRDAQTPEGIPAVLFALYFKQKEISDLLIKYGAQLDAFSAAAAGELEILQKIIFASKSAANQFSVDGYSLLSLACYFGQMECAQYLITQGAEINVPSQNAQQVTPLHAAAAAGRVDIVRLLLENGADVNARQQDGYSAIHTAAQNGNLEMVKLLIQYRADLSQKTALGQSALELAREKQHLEIISLLESRYD